MYSEICFWDFCWASNFALSLSLSYYHSSPFYPFLHLWFLYPSYFSYPVPLNFFLSSLSFLVSSSFHMPPHYYLLLFLFNALLLPLSPPSTPSNTHKHTTSPGDWAGAKVWSQALVGDRQAPERTHWQAVPRALAQPPEPRGEEDIVDWGGGPNHLSGPWEAGKPLGWNR